ncbi:MAG: AsmA-like C-terminal region-containing protein [Gammaproteobacteria bacterium]
MAYALAGKEKANFFYDTILFEGNLLYPKITVRGPYFINGDKKIINADEVTIGFSVIESFLNIKPTVYYFSGKQIYIDLSVNEGTVNKNIPFRLAKSHSLNATATVNTIVGRQFVDVNFVSNQNFSSIIAQQYDESNTLKNSFSLFQNKETDYYSGSLDFNDSKLITNLSERMSSALGIQFEAKGTFSFQETNGSSNVSFKIKPLNKKIFFDPIELDLLGVFKRDKLYLYKNSFSPSLESFLGFVDVSSNAIFLKSLDIHNIYTNASKVLVDISLNNIFINKLGSSKPIIGGELRSGRVQNLYFSKMDGFSGKFVYQNEQLNFESKDQEISITGFDKSIRSYNLKLSSSWTNRDASLIANLRDKNSNFFFNFVSEEESDKYLILNGTNLTLQDLNGLISNQWEGVQEFLRLTTKFEAKKFKLNFYPDNPLNNVAKINIQTLEFRNSPIKAIDIVASINKQDIQFIADEISILRFNLSDLVGLYDFESKDLFFEEQSNLELEAGAGSLTSVTHTKGKYSFLGKRFYSTSILSNAAYELNNSNLSTLNVNAYQIRLSDLNEFYSIGNFRLNDFSFNSYLKGNIDIYKPELNLELELPIQDALLKIFKLDPFLSGSSIANVSMGIDKTTFFGNISSNLVGINIDSPIEIFSKSHDQATIFKAKFERSANQNLFSNIEFANHIFKFNFNTKEQSFYLNELSSAGPGLNLLVNRDNFGFTKISIQDSNFTIRQSQKSKRNFDLKKLPNLNSRIMLANVKINNILFNDLDVYLQKNEKVISLNKLSVKADSFSVIPFQSTEAYISYRFEDKLYHVNGIYEFKKSPKLPFIQSSKVGFDYVRLATNIQFEDLLKLKNIEGSLSILGKDIYFQDKIADSTALNLIGVFNLKRFLGKVINLDLSLNEYARTELSRIEGTLLFNKESANINNAFFVETNAAKMAWKGKIIKKNGDLKNLDLNLDLRIRLQENLPWYAGIIGGIPGVAGSVIFNELFQSELNDLSNYKYRIYGEINNPQLVSIKAN